MSLVAAVLLQSDPSRKTERLFALSPVLMVMLEMINVALAATAADYSQQPPCCKGTTVMLLITFESMSICT